MGADSNTKRERGRPRPRERNLKAKKAQAEGAYTPALFNVKLFNGVIV